MVRPALAARVRYDAYGGNTWSASSQSLSRSAWSSMTCARKGWPPEPHIRDGTQIVEPRGVRGKSALRCDHRHPFAVVEVDDAVRASLVRARSSRLQQCGGQEQPGSDPPAGHPQEPGIDLPHDLLRANPRDEFRRGERTVSVERATWRRDRRREATVWCPALPSRIAVARWFQTRLRRGRIGCYRVDREPNGLRAGPREGARTSRRRAGASGGASRPKRPRSCTIWTHETQQSVLPRYHDPILLLLPVRTRIG